MRRILLATDGSRNALGAAHYVANLYKAASNVEVTVLNISPSIPPLYRELGSDPAVHILFYHYCAHFTEALPNEERRRLNETEKEVVTREKGRMAEIVERAREAIRDAGLKPMSVNYQFH